MPGPGYYGGLLEGMRGGADIQREQASTQLAREEIPMRRLQTAAAAYEFKSQQEQSQLLKKAFESNAYQRYDQQEDQQQVEYINKLQSAGRGIMAFNPKLGMDFLEQAQTEKFKQTENKVNTLKLEGSKLTVRDQIAYGISDQESLNNAIPEFQKIGIALPAKFKEWSPETEEFLGRWALQSKAKKQEVDLAQKLLRGDLAKQEADRKLAADAERTRLKEVDQALKQAGMVKQYKYEEKRVKSEMMQLSENPKFEGLEPVELLTAANDIDRRAFDIHQADPKISTQMAHQMALDEVASRIEIEEGTFTDTKKYKGFEDITKTPEIPSFENWKEPTRKATIAAGYPNPTEEQLKKYYDDKYGNR